MSPSRLLSKASRGLGQRQHRLEGRDACIQECSFVGRGRLFFLVGLVLSLLLLLRTLASVHARPLLLSMPIAGRFYDQIGISHASRETYYKKLRTLAHRYHFALIEFKGHDEDPAFLLRYQSHLTAKGWMFYNRALDDFFNDRVPRT